MSIIICITCTISFIILLIFLTIKYKFTYWKRRGVPFIEPDFPYGNIKGVGKVIHSALLTSQFYRRMKGKSPFVGLYFFVNPVALITDIELVKNILIKDFNYFQDRGFFYNERDDPLSAHLFTLNGPQWKPLRAKLTPTFTSGKMKYLFPTIIRVVDELVDALRFEVKSSSIVELKDFLARFTTDVIGTCAFGIDCNSLKDPNAIFNVMGKRVFDQPKSIMIKRIFMTVFTELSRKLKMKLINEEVSEFFLGIVRETIDFRKNNDVQRNDFMNLLIRLMETGKVDSDEVGKLTFNEVAAQAFIFFLAGYETSATTMTYCLYELAIHQDIQDRARKEINEVLKKHNEEMSYDALMEMTYINQIVNESLRKYPPGGSIIRKVTKDYKVHGTNMILEKGLLIWIPAYAISNDPEFYPNPNKFDPDRFAPGTSCKHNPITFLAFGEGPRNCIGLRFGMLEARIGIATLLKNFKFSICSKTNIPMEFEPGNIILTAKGGLWLNIERVD